MASSASGLAPSWLLGGSSGSGSGLGTSLVLRVSVLRVVCYESVRSAIPSTPARPTAIAIKPNRTIASLTSL